MKKRILPILIIFTVGFIVYANSLFNNFVWEDWEQIVNNPLVQNVLNIPKFFLGGTYFDIGTGKLGGSFYRPMLMTYWSILSSIFGKQAFVFHFTQVLIHIVNVLLVFILFKRFIKEKIAFWLSLIFLVHPINTEAVSYIATVNDPLYFLFGMLGLLLLSKNVLLSGVFLLLSLFSKESGILFFGVYALYAFLFYRSYLKKVLLANIVVLCIYFSVRLGLSHIAFTSGGFFPANLLSLPVRLINIPSIILFYLGTFIFPYNLSIARESYITQVSIFGFILPLLALLLGSFAFFWACKKLIKNHESNKVAIFFSLWFCLGLVPYMQIFGLSASYAERWFYFAEVGVLGLIGVLLGKIFSHKYVNYFLIAILVLFSIRTVVRNFDWKDDATLFPREARVNPNSYIIQNQLGLVSVQAGNDNMGEDQFLRSLSLFPYDPISWMNLGSLYERKKNFPRAIYYFSGAVNRYPMSFAYERISVLQIVLAQWKEAQASTQNGLVHYPNNAQLHFDMGLVLYERGDKHAAIAEINRAYELSGNNLYLDVIKRITSGEKLNIDY